MTTDNVDLGSLEVEHVAAGLRLSLRSRAQFLAPSDDEFALLAERLTTAALTPDSADRPDIRYENEVRLIVKFRCNASITKATGDDLFQAAAQRLKDSQIWRQLQLNVVAVDCSVGVNAADLLITLSRCEDGATQSRRCQHRLRDTGNHLRAVLTPNENAFQLDQIYLNVNIASKPSDLQNEDIRNRRDSLTYDTDNEMLDLTEELAVDQGSESKPGADSSRRVVSTPAHTPSTEGDSPFPRYRSTIQHAVSGHSLLTKRSYSTNDVSASSPKFDLETAVLDLFDAGILLAISSNSKHSRWNLRLVESSSFKPLASIMPDLWSPGYSVAVSARSLFLPTISHALSNVGGVYARNMGLSTKTRELRRRESTQHAPTRQEHGSKNAKSQGLVARRLWQVVQRDLYDAKAAHALRHGIGPYSGIDQGQMFDDLSESESISDDMIDCDDFDVLSQYDADDTGSFIDFDNSPGEGVYAGDAVDEDEPSPGLERSLDTNDVPDDILSVCGSIASLSMLEGSYGSAQSDVGRHSNIECFTRIRLQELDTDEMLDC